MIDGGRVLGVITARGGSKGLPRKNVLHLAGKPLLAWTIEAAKASRLIDHVILSTDDDEIATVGREWGCDVPFMRPAHLAGDNVSAYQVVRDVLERFAGEYSVVVLLQPTSPLRLAVDIDASLEQLSRSKAPSCVSVTTALKSPYWMFKMAEDRHLERLMPLPETGGQRQLLPPVYVVNGAVYVAKTDWLLKVGDFIGDGTVAYVMPSERSIDIDSAADLVLAEWMIKSAK